MGTETILKYKDRLEALALYLGCDWTLLAGQLMQESSGDPGVIGDNGLAYGLSQIHRITLDNHHPDWPMESMLDPDKHMEVYEAEMKRLYRWAVYTFTDGDMLPTWVVFISWNWGCGNVRDYLFIYAEGYDQIHIDFGKAYTELGDGIVKYWHLCNEEAKLFQEDK